MKAHVACLTLLATSAFGQGVTGSITGLVTDPSASVVAGAKVSVKNTATGVVSLTETNSSGVFNVPSLTRRSRNQTGPGMMPEWASSY